MTESPLGCNTTEPSHRSSIQYPPVVSLHRIPTFEGSLRARQKGEKEIEVDEKSDDFESESTSIKTTDGSSDAKKPVANDNETKKAILISVLIIIIVVVISTIAAIIVVLKDKKPPTA